MYLDSRIPCWHWNTLRMPGMNGYEFIKMINEIKPEIKAFLMTAFQINDTEFKRLLPNVKIEGLIQKPISLANLPVLSANIYLQNSRAMSELVIVCN